MTRAAAFGRSSLVARFLTLVKSLLRIASRPFGVPQSKSHASEGGSLVPRFGLCHVRETQAIETRLMKAPLVSTSTTLTCGPHSNVSRTQCGHRTAEARQTGFRSERRLSTRRSRSGHPVALSPSTLRRRFHQHFYRLVFRPHHGRPQIQSLL